MELVYTIREHAQSELLKSLLRRRVELVYTISEHAQSALLKSLLRRRVEPGILGRGPGVLHLRRPRQRWGCFKRRPEGSGWGSGKYLHMAEIHECF